MNETGLRSANGSITTSFTIAFISSRVSGLGLFSDGGKPLRYDQRLASGFFNGWCVKTAF